MATLALSQDEMPIDQRESPSGPAAYADDVLLFLDRWPDVLLVVSTGKTMGQALKIVFGPDRVAGWRYIAARSLQQDERMRDALAEAETAGARFMAQSVVEIADALDGRDDVDADKAAKIRIDARKWLAGQHDQDRYGVRQAAQVQVQVDARSLHLQALQSPEASAILEVPASDVVAVPPPRGSSIPQNASPAPALHSEAGAGLENEEETDGDLWVREVREGESCGG